MIPPLLAIFAWPVVALILFKKFDRAAALCWCIIGGFLLLPAGAKFDLPLLPAVNKYSMPAFAAIAILYIASRQTGLAAREAEARQSPAQPGWLPGSVPLRLLFFVALGGVVLTVVTNGDRLTYGPTRLPGLRPYDAFSVLLVQFVAFLPMLLARKYLAGPEQHKTLLTVLCLSMLMYSIPAMWEIRMSPQLNNTFYGFANGWRQHVRYGGFRPLVFVKHSLWLGMFTACAVMAAFAMSRVAEKRLRKRYLLLGIWLLFVLYMSKTIGALLIVLLLLPMILLLSVSLQMIFAACFAGIVLLYPMLRGADMIPVDWILEQAENADAERGQSLRFRLKNEDILLAKANERPVAGWGSWGRNRVYNEEGEDISVTDGTWVIQIGSGGWVGYASRFGMLTIPIILLFWRRRTYNVDRSTSLLCLLLCGNLLDMIPNSSLMPTTWLIAGALIGRLEYKAVEHDATEAAQDLPVKDGPRYARPRPRHPVMQRGNVTASGTHANAGPHKTGQVLPPRRSGNSLHRK